MLLFATNLQIGVYHCVFSFTLVSCGIFLLLPLLSHLRQGSGFLYRTLTMFSLVSYSMYLLHFAVVQYIAIPRFLELVPIGLQGESLALFKFGLYWLFNIVGSILLYKYFEIPTTEMRNSLSVGKLKVAGPR